MLYVQAVASEMLDIIVTTARIFLVVPAPITDTSISRSPRSSQVQ